MHAVMLTGHGGPDRLEYRTDVAVPKPGTGQVLIRVGASGVNNTDINTRIGWYSKSVEKGTASSPDATADGEQTASVSVDGGWNGEGLSFPRIQGADIAGEIVAVGPDVSEERLGERVLVRTMQTPESMTDEALCVTMGSELDGGFAQFCRVDSAEAFSVRSTMTDIELASFPCAYSTAEGLLHRAGVSADQRVLITGASGGVGSAAVQLVRRRGAKVIAVASKRKWPALASLGAETLLDRDADLVAELGPNSVDVVIDVVAGPKWPALLDVLKPRGTYAVAGAIAGPMVTLDVRTLYLKDLTLLGCTFQPRVVFENLVSYIERGEIVPVVAATYPLRDIARAQQDFLDKDFAGKLVLVPPALSAEA